MSTLENSRNLLFKLLPLQLLFTGHGAIIPPLTNRVEDLFDPIGVWRCLSYISRFFASFPMPLACIYLVN
ncbi:MAG: hypothetical protein SWZ49_05695 [Cyanobacteriota bacterium]|nr:hypothetical protein [Cyanobacteriota bacterium]